MASSSKRRKSSGNERHRVTLGKYANPPRGRARNQKLREGQLPRGKGGRYALFAFSWESYARLLGVTVEGVQLAGRDLWSYTWAKDRDEKGKRVMLGKKLGRKRLFDPTDLESLFLLVKGLESGEFVRRMCKGEVGRIARRGKDKLVREYAGLVQTDQLDSRVRLGLTEDESLALDIASAFNVPVATKSFRKVTRTVRPELSILDED